MLLLQILIHYSLHFLAPGVIAWMLFRKKWVRAWIIMLATMAIDADHLLADPIFDQMRCGIGFHPFHSYYAIAFYFLLLLVPNFYIRVIAVGLLFHMFTDTLDCFWMSFI